MAPLFQLEPAVPRAAPDALHSADRAVKTTSSDPHFLCHGSVLACQSPTANAAIMIAAMGSGGGGSGSGNGIAAASPASSRADARLRLQGTWVLAVFRQRHLVLQCFGTREVQSRELSLRAGDVFSILCGAVAAEVELLRTQRAVEQLQRAGRYREDLEYMAEEMLLALPFTGADNGATSVIGRVSLRASGLPEPPLSSCSAARENECVCVFFESVETDIHARA